MGAKEGSLVTGVAARVFPGCFYCQMGTAEERGVQDDRKVAQINFLNKNLKLQYLHIIETLIPQPKLHLQSSIIP